MLIVQIPLIALIGSLLALDRILIQTMVSRPIVVAPVVGLALGNPYAGLLVGAILELFWIDRLPIGIYIPPNDSLAAAAATSAAVWTGSGPDGVTPEIIALSILLAVPLGVIARVIEVRIVTANNRLSDQALEDAKRLDWRAVERKTYSGLARVFIFYVVFLLAAQTVLIPLLVWMFPKLPAPVVSALTMVYYFLPVLGIAVALGTLKMRGAVPVFCAIFLAAAAAMEFFHVF
ncbi:MAG: PTS sugar transporter subunit IIC [Smithellaceae bacterium]|nr:PTS sugar transporter subunit IIC [Syntrophaceae bacterium]MDD4241688.1 PTS sugar transporter subunit IIC [Smithellaceae bacterium]NLX51967.1 hypothetical protein [Deltaproteobacteria bacterium]